MKIAIIGSREFCDEDLISRVFTDMFNGAREDVLISGGAKGVDSYAEKLLDDWTEWVKINVGNLDKFKITKKIFKPDWDKYGKRAGAIRNKQIVDEADKILAFWDGKSKGTKITIDLAIEKNIPINIYIRNK